MHACKYWLPLQKGLRQACNDLPLQRRHDFRPVLDDGVVDILQCSSKAGKAWSRKVLHLAGKAHRACQLQATCTCAHAE